MAITREQIEQIGQLVTSYKFYAEFQVADTKILLNMDNSMFGTEGYYTLAGSQIDVVDWLRLREMANQSELITLKISSQPSDSDNITDFASVKIDQIEGWRQANLIVTYLTGQGIAIVKPAPGHHSVVSQDKWEITVHLYGQPVREPWEPFPGHNKKLREIEELRVRLKNKE